MMMRTLYLECAMGAAGDMLAAALLELLPDREGFVNCLNALGIPGICYKAEPTVRCGIAGTRLKVTVNGMEEHPQACNEHVSDGKNCGTGGNAGGVHQPSHHHHHRGMDDIRRIVGGIPVPEKVRNDIMAVYGIIADAESHVHGRPVSEIHFHEVGAMDAIADITAVCMLMNEIGAERVMASPICVGSGTVTCAHGILPVPAPATAHILMGIPIYSTHIGAELCTPTGAALLKYFAADFGPLPPMVAEAVGYGCGAKDFEQANCVRAILGKTRGGQDRVVELKCNIDDMTGEDFGHAIRVLQDAGALEVYTVPIGMKKNRPGVLLVCMCGEEKRDDMIRLIFRHTSTIGIREAVCNRHILRRSFENIQTSHGNVRIKKAEGWGVVRKKCEFEDIARIAGQTGKSLNEVRDSLKGLS